MMRVGNYVDLLDDWCLYTPTLHEMSPSLPSPEPKTDHVKTQTHEHPRPLQCCEYPYTTRTKVVDDKLK